MIEESGSKANIYAVRAFHNPSPIKINFDKALLIKGILSINLSNLYLKD